MKLSQHCVSFIFFCFLCVSFWACSNKSEQKDTTNLARVGNSYLTLEEAKQSIPSAMYKQDSSYALKQYRKQWIRRQLVVEEADKANLKQKKEVQAQLKQAKYEVLREALRRYIIAAEVDSAISDQEAKQYFEAHKEHFALEEPYVQFRHVATPNIKDARSAKRELRNETAWEIVAANYAQNPNKAIQESKEYHPLSTVMKEVDIMHQYLENLNNGQISAIQRVNGIYHFVQLLDRRSTGEIPKFEWLKDEIKNWIILDKRQRKFSSYLKNLYLKADADNEIETFNVLPTKSNSKHTSEDTLESTSTYE